MENCATNKAAGIELLHFTSWRAVFAPAVLPPWRMLQGAPVSWWQCALRDAYGLHEPETKRIMCQVLIDSKQTVVGLTLFLRASAWSFNIFVRAFSALRL